ncbi:MAG: hypothetical protein ABIS07_07770 [Dokdonella sp.]
MAESRSNIHNYVIGSERRAPDEIEDVTRWRGLVEHHLCGRIGDVIRWIEGQNTGEQIVEMIVTVDATLALLIGPTQQEPSPATTTEPFAKFGIHAMVDRFQSRSHSHGTVMKPVLAGFGVALR